MNHYKKSSFTVNPKENEDLMSRLSAFLPKIQQANQDISEDHRVDLHLGPLNDREEDVESNSSDIDSKGDGKEPSEAPRTIQLDLTIGKEDENPAIALLAATGDESDQERSALSDFSDSKESKGTSFAVEANISEMLDVKPANTRSTSLSGKKRPLITELV